MQRIIANTNRFAYLAAAGMAVVLIVGLFAGFFPLDSARFSVVSSVMTVALALPAAYAVMRSCGSRKGALVLFLLSAYAFAIELIGTKTGFPYGDFVYHGTTAKLFGLVPWTTPFGWVPLVIGASAFAGGYIDQKWKRVLLALTVLVACDFVLDPGAVALGIWSYARPGIYYGVPFTNFLGWVLTGGVALSFLRSLEWKGRSAIAGVGLMTAFWTGVALMRGQVLPSVIGFIVVVAMSWRMFYPQKEQAHP